jgi:hypothetical protein
MVLGTGSGAQIRFGTSVSWDHWSGPTDWRHGLDGANWPGMP